MDKSNGFWAVLAGLGALVVIVAIALLQFDGAADVVSVTTAAGTVIGTVVGAFFGVATGQEGRKQAEEGRKEAEIAKEKAQLALVQVAAAAQPDSPAAKAAVEAIG
ncbi:hypothetical protein EV193_109189 [Herbihabitans rhizosphaerae]|uniref:Superfamily III holin-X n=1 Tax=Herbihabitans rhizosphaerae TaxID=1872711 RepID=A0A4Q7KHM5_9PSEU|nr:hypothetical protein [Herbihabitans rhizosphaerae]RZS34398.1 hypothetical protein EV193_109189 [Herbihabitans rhizosphaerae]